MFRQQQVLIQAYHWAKSPWKPTSKIIREDVKMDIKSFDPSSYNA